jgi:hypothetical protein
MAAAAAAWGWTLLAGVGGFVLLLRLGPWPLTNGWFAMFSGIAACPLLPALLRRALGVEVRWQVLLAIAATIMIAGRITVAVQGPRPPIPPATSGVWSWGLFE